MQLRFIRGFDKYYIKPGNTLVTDDKNGNMVSELLMDVVAVNKKSDLKVTLFTFGESKVADTIKHYVSGDYIHVVDAADRHAAEVLADIYAEGETDYLRIFVLDNAPLSACDIAGLKEITDYIKDIRDDKSSIIIWSAMMGNCPTAMLDRSLWDITCWCSAPRGSGITVTYNCEGIPAEDASHELVHHDTWVGQKKTFITGVRWVHRTAVNEHTSTPIADKIEKSELVDSLVSGSIETPMVNQGERLSLMYSAGNLHEVVLADLMNNDKTQQWSFSVYDAIVVSSIWDDTDYCTSYAYDVSMGKDTSMPALYSDYITAKRQQRT